MQTKNVNLQDCMTIAISDADFKVIILIYVSPTAFINFYCFLRLRIWPQLIQLKLLPINNSSK